MKESAIVDWRYGSNLLSQDELFELLSRRVDEFDDISHLPHLPKPIPGVFYTCEQPIIGDGSRLDQFLDFFSPSTPEDRQLMLAALVTMFWNGPPGQRVGFIISAQTGQGGGKTTFVHAIAKLVGGVIDAGQNADVEKVKTRLLSSGADGMRAVLTDNVKASRYSNGEFESLVTSPIFSGHRMYKGEASRKNYITFFLTMNSPSFSRDISQRFINIVLGEPKYSGKWQSEIDRFVDDHRGELLSDIAGFFGRERVEISKFNRWGEWQSEILSRLDHPRAIAQAIKDRENTNDADKVQAEEIEEFIRERLSQRGLVSPFAIHIPIAVLAGWISEAIGEQTSARIAGQLLDRYEGSNMLICLSRNPSHKNGKGFVWRSPNCSSSPDYKEEDFWRPRY